MPNKRPNAGPRNGSGGNKKPRADVVELDSARSALSSDGDSAAASNGNQDRNEPVEETPTPEPGFPSGYHVMHDITASGVRKYYIPAYKFRENVSQEELDLIPKDYWEENSQHDPNCDCVACCIIWDKSYTPDWSCCPPGRPE